MDKYSGSSPPIGGEVGRRGLSRRAERARELRRNPSRAERICWDRAHRLEGIKFRRQHPIDRYFADFACVSRKLVVEIDGHHHADQVEADALRTAVMERHGWHVVRFAANEVVQNPEGIWVVVRGLLDKGTSP